MKTKNSAGATLRKIIDRTTNVRQSALAIGISRQTLYVALRGDRTGRVSAEKIVRWAAGVTGKNLSYRHLQLKVADLMGVTWAVVK